MLAPGNSGCRRGRGTVRFRHGEHALAGPGLAGDGTRVDRGPARPARPASHRRRSSSRTSAPWSTVMRIPTDAGDVWFKANGEALRHEAALVDAARRARAPTACPPLLASRPGPRLDADGRRGRAAARRSSRRSAASTAGWTCCRATPRSSSRWPTTWTSCSRSGVPDLRLAVLPAQYDAAHGRDRRRAAVPRRRAARRATCATGSPRSASPRPSSTTTCTTARSSSATGGTCARLGRRLRLAPLLHALGDAGGRASRGGSTTSRTPADIAPFRDAYLAPYAAQYDGVDLVAAAEPGDAPRLGLPRGQRPRPRRRRARRSPGCGCSSTAGSSDPSRTRGAADVRLR